MTRRAVLAALAALPLWARRATGQPPGRSANDLVWLDIATIRARIGAGTLSVVDLTEAYLLRIARLNPSLTAYVTVTADRARQDARRAQDALRSSRPVGSLAGVPIAHKDLFETAGIRTMAGSRLFERYVPERDATIVSRLAAAGTVLLGKCNMHELGGGVTTINPFFGTTLNPWDHTRVAGGSSGGSAAAVAGGLAAAATGSDTGGSVRIPAAFCGCVGFKPTFGRLSTAGLLGSVPSFDHSGLLTRTVADLMMMDAQAAGYDVRDASTVPTANVPEPAAPGAPLRVGVARNFFFDKLQPEVAQAVESAIEVFRSAKADVRDLAFPIDAETMGRVFDPIVIAEIHQRFAADWRARPDAFSSAFAEFFRVPVPSTLEIVAAQRALGAYQSAVRHVFDGVDIVVTPTVAVTAPRIEGAIDGALILRNTWPFNAARTPALSLPCGVDSQGLPVGLQLVAAPYAERTLFRAGEIFQRLTTWHLRHPP